MVVLRHGPRVINMISTTKINMRYPGEMEEYSSTRDSHGLMATGGLTSNEPPNVGVSRAIRSENTQNISEAKILKRRKAINIGTSEQ